VFGLFPKKDFDQTLRIKRFLMAFGAYIIWSAICFIGYSLELTTVPLRILVAGISASFVLNILLYVIFRTGLNKSFKDPSLTLLQMVIATFWIMVVVYYAYECQKRGSSCLYGCACVRIFQIENPAVSFSVGFCFC
jgi:hypothetical protein